MKKITKKLPKELGPTNYRTTTKIGVVLLRVTLGWLMFYAGITKVLDPSWSATGFLENAANFQSFFLWFTQPEILPITNFLNAWGLTLIGAALILGLFTRVSALFGAFLMLLYYLPLPQPYPGPHAFVVDDHLIYFVAFLMLAAISSGRFFGLDKFLRKSAMIRQSALLRHILG